MGSDMVRISAEDVLSVITEAAESAGASQRLTIEDLEYACGAGFGVSSTAPESRAFQVYVDLDETEPSCGSIDLLYGVTEELWFGPREERLTRLRVLSEALMAGGLEQWTKEGRRPRYVLRDRGGQVLLDEGRGWFNRRTLAERGWIRRRYRAF